MCGGNEMERFGLKESIIKDEILYQTFQKAYFKLKEFIDTDNKTEISQMAIIHAYEYTFELWWRAVQKHLEYIEDIQDYGPNATIKNAFQYGVIEDGQTWMDMLKDRNMTAHTYKEDVANDIYQRIITKHIHALQQFVEDFDGKI